MLFSKTTVTDQSVSYRRWDKLQAASMQSYVGGGRRLSLIPCLVIFNVSNSYGDLVSEPVNQPLVNFWKLLPQRLQDYLFQPIPNKLR